MPTEAALSSRPRSLTRDFRSGKSDYYTRKLGAHDEDKGSEDGNEKRWCYFNHGGKGGWIETCPPDTRPTYIPSTTPGRFPMEFPTPAPQPPGTPVWTDYTPSNPLPTGPYTGLYTQCNSAVPKIRASELAHQLIEYKYRMNLDASADPESKLRGIEERLHPMLRDEFLDCIPDIDSHFEVHALSSLPEDVLSPEKCTTNDDTKCVWVNGAITPDIYYIVHDRRTRRLHGADTLTDPFVIKSFANFFENAFSDVSGELKDGDDQILGFEFVGFPNMQDQDSYGADEIFFDRRGENQFSGIIAGKADATSEDTLIGGFVFLSMACFALVVVITLIVTRRKRTAARLLDESIETDAATGQNREMDVSVEGTGSFEVNDDEASNQYKRASAVEGVTVMGDINHGRFDEPEGFEVQATLGGHSTRENMYATSLMDIVDEDEDDDEGD